MKAGQARSGMVTTKSRRGAPVKGNIRQVVQYEYYIYIFSEDNNKDMNKVINITKGEIWRGLPNEERFRVYMSVQIE